MEDFLKDFEGGSIGSDETWRLPLGWVVRNLGDPMVYPTVHGWGHEFVEKVKVGAPRSGRSR